MKQEYHQSSVENIAIEDAIKNNDLVWVDVRTSKEFADGTIPSAINLPLFSNNDRAVIGTLYKNMGKKIAIDKGYEIIASEFDAFQKRFSILEKDKPIVVMCQRGGMRSRSVTAFLKSGGYNVKQLKNGYKAYRNYTLNELSNITPKYPLIVIHGRTGVGKTLLLNKLTNSLDLEGIAQHRSSLFGAIGKIPIGQKAFEAHLLHNWNCFDLNTPIFIEGESRKVGPVFIPDRLSTLMKNGILIYIEADIEKRVERTIADYQPEIESCAIKIKEVIKSLKGPLSSESISKLLSFMDKKQYGDVVRFLYENYYDPRYDHAMLNYSYFKKINADNMESALEELNKIRENL